MLTWLYQHLKETKTYQLKPDNHSLFSLYILHAIFGLREGAYFIFQGIATIIHGIFPFVFDFQLARWNQRMMERTHKLIPKHPMWKRWGWRPEHNGWKPKDADQ